MAEEASRAIGFVGIGQMGWPMAARLVGAGETVVVYDVRKKQTDNFVQQVGGRAARTLAALAAECDAVITMLPNSRIVGEALFDGADNLAAGLKPGSLLMEMSSGLPRLTQEFAARLNAAGIDCIDAPVSGGVARAIKGDLAIMLGGADEAIARAEPLLRPIGTSFLRTGGIGSAHAMKALNNLVSAGGLLISIEALLIGRNFGLDPALMVDVLNVSSGMTNASKVKLKQHVLSGSYGSGFSLDLMVKDLTTALEIARDGHVGAPFSALCRELWATAQALIGTGQDHTAYAKAAELLAGTVLAGEAAANPGAGAKRR